MGSLLLWGALLLPAVASSASAQTDDARSKVDAELQQRINEAIRRGVDWLLRQQEIDGSWRNQAAGYRNGQTALSVYTLAKCDLRANHPSLARAVLFLSLQAPTKTYSAALQIMALCALDADQYHDWVAEIAEELESWQNGGFGYPDGIPDLSNTQYAALGLAVAAKHGYKGNRRVWERFVNWTLEQQQAGNYGGFRYRGSYKIATGSMTAAGITVLAICRDQLTHVGRPTKLALQRAEAWLANHFQIASNPYRQFDDDGSTGNLGGESYYYVYSLERVGALLSTSHFGEHDWYKEGATWLLDKQLWAGNWGGQADTCFALLFLARATARETFTGRTASQAAYTYGDDSSSNPVSLRAAGRGPIKAWVSSFGKYTIEDFGWKTEQGLELHVARVEYRVEDPMVDGKSRLLTTIGANPEQPNRAQRYPSRLQLDVAGSYKIFARVYLKLPPIADEELFEGDARPEDDLQAVDSQVLIVDVYQTNEALLGIYAGDSGANLLNSPRTVVSTSSSRNDEMAGSAAFDGRMGTHWISATDDPKPSIHFELPARARADLLLLTLGNDDPGGIPPRYRNKTNSPALITKLRVRINADKQGILVDVDSNPRRKISVPLGRMLKVHSIDIEVLEVRRGGRKDQGVGFAEVELLVQKQRDRR